MNQIDEVWSLVYSQMQSEINKSTFDLWFSGLTLIELTETDAVLLAVNIFKRNILMNSFIPKLEDFFEKIMGVKIKVKVVAPEDLEENGNAKTESVKTPASAVAQEKADESSSASTSASTVTRTDAGTIKVIDEDKEDVGENESEKEEIPFFSGNESYTFENFIVGNSNKLAHAACVAVANNTGYDYNPLFIHGPSGLGKTHLLHAVANRIKEKKSKTNIIYVTSEDFTNQLIKSISSKTTEQFRDKFRNADILMIDDIQFIAKRENTQEEIFHTFNALYDKGVQIILTSDRPARDINPLEERLLTRFNWGITADINPPDFELRAAILTSKAKSKGIELTPDIVNLLAENLTDNIRQLEGAVKKLCAIKILSDKPITLDVAREAIGDIVNRNQISVDVTIDKILDKVSKRYGVTVDDLKSKNKSSNVTTARQIAMYIIRRTTGLSLPKIGKIFNRDHSTTLSSVKKIENELKCNSLFEIDVNEIIKEILT